MKFYLVSTRDVGLIASACGEGHDKTGHILGFARAFASRIHKV